MVSTAAKRSEQPAVSAAESDQAPADNSILLTFPEDLPLSDELLEQISQLNKPWQFERTAEGRLAIMAPASNSSDEISVDLAAQLRNWVRSGIGGMAQGSSGGFLRPDNSVAAPDAAWVSPAGLAALSPDERKSTFLPVCPDFLIEVRSPSQTIAQQQHKLEQWIKHGTQLAWLIIPEDETVHVYQADGSIEIFERPETLSAEPTCPGLAFSFEYVWNLQSEQTLPAENEDA